ncbi:nucleotide-binding universal stress UspA family protein [Kribbella amoyensis]|uniref:Nucleotide-binding universal stress UspA family protein n=1 Tax=Kribbella amoyensis TaxID=996641 RepID=A0A561BS86_9ACTN|nr:universal stress protein [Kribbella amoyensis]TWD81760.1 nucleotide-binding universal stress UspA family protein [Kribbella amoyensis]
MARPTRPPPHRPGRSDGPSTGEAGGGGRTGGVVVGLDGSADGLLALAWATDLARRRHWTVHGVHVVGTAAAAGFDDGQEVLEDAADELARLGCTDAVLELRTGQPAEVLLDVSATADALVIGRRGAGGFAELLMGSTSQVCAALARTSLVVVPDTWKRDEGELGLVVVGVDGSPSCRPAVGFAFETAAERGAELVLVHVPEDAPETDADGTEPRWQRNARALVTAALDDWPDRYPDVVFRTHYRPGHPVQVLARHSATADLVVVGGLGRPTFTPLRLGSVSRGLLLHSHCPVAIIHAETAQALIAKGVRS